MSEINLITQALTAAQRHMGNPAVDVLVDKLATARLIAAQDGLMPAYDPLAGYKKGAEGEDGYSLMHSMDRDMARLLIGDSLQKLSQLREVAVTTECLIAVLNALGENIEY